VPAVDTIFEQALALPEEERGELIARLLRSLEPDVGDELTTDAWEAAWSSEIERRANEVRSGSVALVDGDDVLREMRALVEAP
jgi:putative addiction module component (TIGR02574 family)